MRLIELLADLLCLLLAAAIVICPALAGLILINLAGGPH